MRQYEFCNHYRAMSDHQTCKAGVSYDDFKGLKFDQRPCFKDHGCAAPGGCDQAVFPTPEEIAERDRLREERFKKTREARAAIVAHLGGTWKRSTPGSSGVIDCPACGTGKLHFSRAGYNGHIHAHCETEGCVSWIE